MNALIISQTPEVYRSRKVLWIDVDSTRKLFLFEYFEHLFVSLTNLNRENPRYKHGTWRRECGFEDGFDEFERFLELKRWFSKHEPQRPESPSPNR